MEKNIICKRCKETIIDLKGNKNDLATSFEVKRPKLFIKNFKIGKNSWPEPSEKEIKKIKEEIGNIIGEFIKNFKLFELSDFVKIKILIERRKGVYLESWNDLYIVILSIDE